MTKVEVTNFMSRNWNDFGMRLQQVINIYAFSKAASLEVLFHQVNRLQEKNEATIIK